MSEFLEDPSVLTKDKLKSELLANSVPLPSGEQKKDVYVQLYLQHLTAQNKARRNRGAPEAFSSDEELPSAPPVSNRNRSGRKATKKTDKPRPEDVDVAELTDEDLKDQLLKYGVSVGPIVASTRKLYEKKLQKLLDQGPPETLPLPSAPLRAADANQNGNTDSEKYSDNEEDEKLEPIVEKLEPVKTRVKTTPSLRTRRYEHNRVEERLEAGDVVRRKEAKDLLEEMFPYEPRTPTGITATCRRPIHGAAGRPLNPSDFRLDDSILRRTEFTETSVFTERRAVQRGAGKLAAAPPALSYSSSSSSSSSAAKLTAPSGGQSRSRRSLPVWLQLLLLMAVAGFLFFVYQAMETNEINPFSTMVSPASPSSAEKPGGQ